MAATNKTSNYALSQFAGTDKPSFISDYNSDMTKIDGAIKDVDTKAGNAATVSYSKAESDGKYAPKSAAAPTATGLTAAQYDLLYVDSNNIVRVKVVSGS